jgi:hypothetical protein
MRDWGPEEWLEAAARAVVVPVDWPSEGGLVVPVPVVPVSVVPVVLRWWATLRPL